MKKTVSMLALAISIMGASYAQDCGYYFTQKKGVVLRRANYTGASKKLVGYSEDKIVDVQASKVDIETQAFDKDNKPGAKNNFTMKCEAGVYKIDFASMMGGEGALPDLKITGDNIEFPASLQVGMKMKDANVTMSASNAMMNMNMRIYDRKVEAYEKVQTPAGTFDCYKVVSTTETTMSAMPSMKIVTKTTLWVDVKIGNIKMESYDQTGKLASTNILEAIK